jgi:hypothetical protein
LRHDRAITRKTDDTLTGVAKKIKL